MQGENGLEICDVFCSDPDKVRRVKEIVGEVGQAAIIFKALGDETRCKIAYALSLAELCVCDLANIVGLTVPAVSYHLRILRDLKLVKYRREGKVVFYSLNDDHVVSLVREAMAHAREGPGE